MTIDPQAFIARAEFDDIVMVESDIAAPLDLDTLPPGVVSGTTLIDFSAVPSMAVRAGVSQSMLFASRVASKAMKPDDDADDWLAAYTTNLGELGFSITGTGVVKSTFQKTGVEVHQAIVPFLTVAFGGAAIGPIILAGLKNLQAMDEGAPWITLFDRETRRFDAQEMHFAAVSSSATDTTIRYAVARLHVQSATTSILFFKLTKAEAEFESSSTSMSANNSLLAVIESQLRERLAALSQAFIVGADL